MRDYLRSHPCIDCGETDIVTLQFDHRDRATNRQELALLVIGTPWSVIAAEIESCDVRCANCHRRRTATQLGWHRGDVPRLLREDEPIVGTLADQSATRRCTGCSELKPLDSFRFATDPAEHDGRVARPACVDTLVITINEIGSDTSMKIGDASDARVET
jgi:hypothetical protein